MSGDLGAQTTPALLTVITITSLPSIWAVVLPSTTEMTSAMRTADDDRAIRRAETQAVVFSMLLSLAVSYLGRTAWPFLLAAAANMWLVSEYEQHIRHALDETRVSADGSGVPAGG